MRLYMYEYKIRDRDKHRPDMRTKGTSSSPSLMETSPCWPLMWPLAFVTGVWPLGFKARGRSSSEYMAESPDIYEKYTLERSETVLEGRRVKGKQEKEEPQEWQWELSRHRVGTIINLHQVQLACPKHVTCVSSTPPSFLRPRHLTPARIPNQLYVCPPTRPPLN